MNPSATRNTSIDTLRLAAAIGVICLHVTQTTFLPAAFWDAVNLLSRYAVPCFFMISGYFTGTRILENPAYVLRPLSSLAALYLLANLLYLPWCLLRDHPPDIDFILLVCGTAFHLWFLPSLGFALLLLALAVHARKLPLLSCLAASVTILYCLADVGIIGIPDSVNFLRFLNGLSYLLLGILISRMGRRGTLPPVIPLIIGVAAGLILQYWEANLSAAAYQRPLGFLQQGFGTILYSICLMLLAVKGSFTPPAALARRILFAAGLSSGVYIWHVWVDSILKNTIEHFVTTVHSPAGIWILPGTVLLTFAIVASWHLSRPVFRCYLRRSP